MKYHKTITAAKCAVFLIAFTLILVPGTVLAAALKATPDHFEFGDLKEGDPAKVTVEIENTSSAPVEITNVRTS